MLLRHEASILHATKGASIYPQPTADADRFVIMGGIEMWRGYFSSLRPAPGKLIVNVDSTAMAFVQTGDLVKLRGVSCPDLTCQVCCAFANMSDPARLAQLTDRLRLQLARFLRNVKVKVMVGASRDPATRKIIEYSPCVGIFAGVR